MQNKKVEKENLRLENLQRLKIQKEEAVVVRKRKISRIREDDDDFLTKQHPDILAEALKHKFQFKFAGKDIDKKDIESEINDPDKLTHIDEENNDNESISSNYISDLLQETIKSKFIVRMFDEEYTLIIVKEYLIYYDNNNKDEDKPKNCFKINNYVDIFQNEKIINGKYKGLVTFKDTLPETKNPEIELDIYFNKESDFRQFLEIIKRI